MIEIKASAGERWTLAICTGLMALLGAFVVAVAVGTVASSPAAAALVALGGAAIVGVGLLVVGEMLAAFRLRIAVADGRVELRLPARRGHVVHAEVNETIALASIDRIETRAEAFRQLGVAAVQQAYRLRLKDGRAIDLGADRQMKPPLFGRAAEAIAAAADAPIEDRGMVDGGAGVLAVVGTSVPEWSAPSLAAGDIVKRRAAAARAFSVMAWTAALVALARLIARR